MAGAVAVGRQVTAVGAGNGPGDRQADTGSTVDVASAGVLDAVEAFEDVGEGLGGDADAVVGDADHGPVVLVSHRDLDPVAAHRVLQGVAQQVVQDLPDASGIRVDAQAGNGLGVQRHPGGVVGVPGCGDAGRHDLVEVLVAQRQWDAAFLGAGDLRDVGGQGGQPLVLPKQDLDVCRGEVDHTVLQSFEGDLGGGQRGAQLMAQVGEHASSGLLRGGDLAGHVVKGVSDLGQLGAGRGHHDGLVVVSGGDMLGAVHEGFDPARQVPVEDGGDPEGGEHRGAQTHGQ